MCQGLLDWQNAVFDELSGIHNRYRSILVGDVDLVSRVIQQGDFEAIPKSVSLLEVAAPVQSLVNISELADDPLFGNPLTASGWKIAFSRNKKADSF